MTYLKFDNKRLIEVMKVKTKQKRDKNLILLGKKNDSL